MGGCLINFALSAPLRKIVAYREASWRESSDHSTMISRPLSILRSVRVVWILGPSVGLDLSSVLMGGYRAVLQVLLLCSVCVLGLCAAVWEFNGDRVGCTSIRVTR